MVAGGSHSAAHERRGKSHDGDSQGQRFVGRVPPAKMQRVEHDVADRHEAEKILALLSRYELHAIGRLGKAPPKTGAECFGPLALKPLDEYDPPVRIPR